MSTKQTNKPNTEARVQLTCNVGEHLYGQTFTRSQAEQFGIDAKHLRDFVTDRAIKSADTETR